MQKHLFPILLPLGLFFLFIFGMALIQFATPDLPDNDGFYHIKLAQLMRTEGLKPAFPWLPLSILNQDEFYDHHFLFHGALIPFTFGDLRVGAKWAAVIFASLAFLAVWYLLYRQRVPYAWLWALALLGISDAFLYRMSIARAQSLSLAVLAIAFAWILEGKYKHLALLSFIYVWMYDAFPLMLALAFLHLISISLIERRLELRPLLYIAGGMILGLIINPYFPENLIFSYHHMLPKLTDATSVRVGNEWFPYETDQLLRNSLPSLIAFVSGTLALGFSGRKMDVRTAFAFLVTLLFGLMLFQARRFVEYFPPFALIFAAFAWAPLLDVQHSPALPGTAGQVKCAPGASVGSARGKPVSDISIDSAVQRLSVPRRVHIPAMLLSLAVIASIARSIPQAREAINNSKPYGLYADASAWLEQNTPPGARVFQTDWDDFPRLFFYNTHNIYLVGLDPTYMQIHDPALYDRWVDITQGGVENPSQIIASQFESHYVHTDLNHEDFLQVADEDPGLKEVYRDDQAVIFEVVALP